MNELNADEFHADELNADDLNGDELNADEMNVDVPYADEVNAHVENAFPVYIEPWEVEPNSILEAEPNSFDIWPETSRPLFKLSINDKTKDVIIRPEGNPENDIRLHKCVLVSQSKYFDVSGVKGYVNMNMHVIF